jgi:hypothetical protein
MRSDLGYGCEVGAIHVINMENKRHRVLDNLMIDKLSLRGGPQGALECSTNLDLNKFLMLEIKK